MYHSRPTSALAMVALAAILMPSFLTAQITFQRTYGGTGDDCGCSVQQTADGGYIIAGETWSFGAGGGDVYLIKTNAAGDTQWTRTFGGAEYDVAYSVQQTLDGGYIIAGADSFPPYGTGVYLVKTDANGGALWTRTIGGGGDYCAYSVRQTRDGGYIVTGLECGDESTMANVLLVKTDANGDTLWTRIFYGTGWDDYGSSVQQTTDGGYVIAGANSTGLGDVYLIKTDASGDTLWTRTFGGDSIDEAEYVQQTSDGGYVIAGSTCSFGAGSSDVYVIRTDAAGTMLWSSTYGGASLDFGCSAQQIDEGTYVIAGSTSSFGAGGRDFYLIRTDADGDTLWTRTFGGDSDDVACSFQQTADGGYIMAGYSASFGAGGEDVWLVKTDSLGNVGVAEPRTSPTRTSCLVLTCEPNPFRTRTAISLQLAANRPARLAIFDASGRCVRTFTVNRAPYTVWDGTDELGQPLPSGAYFVRVDATNEHATARIVLQR